MADIAINVTPIGPFKAAIEGSTAPPLLIGKKNDAIAAAKNEAEKLTAQGKTVRITYFKADGKETHSRVFYPGDSIDDEEPENGEGD